MSSLSESPVLAPAVGFRRIAVFTPWAITEQAPAERTPTRNSTSRVEEGAPSSRNIAGS